MRTHFGRLVAGFFSMTVVALCLVTVAGAQQTLGSINGTILDNTGAAIPGSTVTVTDAAIGVTRTAKTQANGFFEIFNLPIGTYTVQATHDGFETTNMKGVTVQEARATTVTTKLKIGEVSSSVDVTSNPMLNATDATNGYTLDASELATLPLATGSFTQAAVLSPGVTAELLSGLDSNGGLGNQPIWANGQRDTSNTFQVNGVDTSNLFNGKSSSGSTSQRYNFNIGAGSTSASSTAGGGTIGGANPTGTSVYGSNGNSLPSPPQEFIQELRVNTSMYDAQQGATSGAQIDVNTLSGTNAFHGQIYGNFAGSTLNADPFFFKQSYLLGQQGIGAFPASLENPPLQRYVVGGTMGGPIKKDKLFFFVGYEHGGESDQSTGLSQMTVPSGLTDDRSPAGLIAAATSWNNGVSSGGVTTSNLNPIAVALMNAKLPNGQYMIPSAQSAAKYVNGVPNVTLIGSSVMNTDLAAAAVDYQVTGTDRMSVKFFYQNDPVTKPYGYAQTGGFPVTDENGSQVGSIDNTMLIGSHLNWEQRLGYSRMQSYSYFQQQVSDPTLGPTFGVGAGQPNIGGQLAGLTLTEFADNVSTSPALKVGPDSAFADTGFAQSRINPSTNVIYNIGKHTIAAGGGYSYTQLNIQNYRSGLPLVATKTFATFLEGAVKSSTAIASITPQHNDALRYYRSNEAEGYVQDKWQVMPNFSITGGVRYDYHGGLTEKFGNMFNFDPKVYNVTGTDTTGFTVLDAGFVAAPNNKYLNGVSSQDIASSNSTLSGRQWGISPRVAFAWAPEKDENKVVFSGGFGLYYDRGELFSYLSQPAGGAASGPFGVTESSPLVTDIAGNGSTLANPLGTNGNVSALPNFSAGNALLQKTLNGMTGKGSDGLVDCSGLDSQTYPGYLDCADTLYFGAYNKNNVLPYTMNFTLKMQWQPRPDTAISIGYVGNRGRHAVVPIPFNEPQVVTPSTPGTVGGASPHSSGENYSYGFEVLNQNSPVVTSAGTVYAPIANEPWNTESGGNTDFRAPYVGYNPNAALFTTSGNSAYDGLQTHIEKRMSHDIAFGASYTWSHTLDEQSDIGLFFTGNDPANLRQSYGASDYDRTNVFSANFEAKLPNAVKDHSALSYVTNDWAMSGIAILQSGQPYSLYEFYGAAGSINFGDYPLLMNPVLGIKNPANPRSALTGNSGKFRAPGGSYMPAIDPSQIAINYLMPGQKGVPVSTGNDPQDIYETDFAPGNQRNIFRQAFQKRVDLSFRKTFKFSDRYGLLYTFDVYNLTNTTSSDVPQDEIRIRQNDSCSATAKAVAGSVCANGDQNYGQVITSNSSTDQQSALANLDVMPTVSGSGRSTTVPVTANGANFGSVTGTIGGSRAITMSLHFTY